MTQTESISVGVLALQGAFSEHIQLLRAAAATRSQIGESASRWRFLEVRTINELDQCDALIVPGGESTTISLIAERCGLLEPLRNFVKYATSEYRDNDDNPLTVNQSTPQANMGHLRWLDIACRVGESNQEGRAGTHWWSRRPSESKSLR